MFRIIKLYAGMTGEYEVIFTGATNEAIIEYMTETMHRQEKGEEVENIRDFLYERGFFCSVLGNQDTEGLEDIYIHEEFDYYDYGKKDEVPAQEECTIEAIIFRHGKDDYGLWEGFTLSAEDEAAVWSIFEKYTTEGCSVRGTKKDIMEEFI